jgi:DNA repair protein RadD
MLKLRPYQEKCLTALKERLKETDVPLLVNASVGSGKSVIIAELLLVIERAGWRALCLTMNSTLIRQNAEAYNLQGGHAGIFCAALDRKDTKPPVIFASPQSVIKATEKAKKKGFKANTGEIAFLHFNLIVIDEAHNINISDPKTTYIKIFNWYAQLAKDKGHKIRFVGLTGTPYRGKGHSIVGKYQFFKEEVCSISAEWLISRGYLTNPIWGTSKHKLKYDFDNIKTNSFGRFNNSEIKKEFDRRPRLTSYIMREVQEIVASRRGAFIFATSIEHCKECMLWLPENETALITGDTPDELRHKYISSARCGEIKYLVNVNVLCTGVDVPNFDTVVFVRPTESLVLYMQAIGRGLRLHPGKQDCLVLDYAGNLERHGDIDNPIINEAIKTQSKDDPDYCIPCYQCQTFNKVTARRCIGSLNQERCDHYFEFKDCVKCGVKNDITARSCRECYVEILDPNRNLTGVAANPDTIIVKIKRSSFGVKLQYSYDKVVFWAHYETDKHWPKKNITEEYITWSKKARDYFYFSFVKKQFKDPSGAYPNINEYYFLDGVIKRKGIKEPTSLVIAKAKDNEYKIIKKIFD